MHLSNIAIVGAGGQLGKFITIALIAEKKYAVTAISRENSTSQLAPGLTDIKKVDYSSHTSLVEALKGQEVLIITMSMFDDGTAQKQLVDAAKDAGVQWIMPNEYGTDPAHNEQLANDTKLGPPRFAIRRYIEDAGMTWIALSCGFWYEFSLAGSPIRYGFDFKKKSVTFYDDGKTRIPTSTWPQAGLAVSRIFALPLERLVSFKNRAVYVNSFFISQRDMFDSVLRVTGENESDWTINYEAAADRFQRGGKMISEGNLEGMGLRMYSRVFFADGASDFTSKLNNKELGLPQENLDEATKVAMKMAEMSNGHWSFRW